MIDEMMKLRTPVEKTIMRIGLAAKRLSFSAILAEQTTTGPCSKLIT
ncbi:hypothetical protein [Bradyrhizobium sp. CCBAU 11386]|jgi:hypothetical protein|nr:hypothetical protein [Bradyrhizobium sp. CCBAU 11386]